MFPAPASPGPQAVESRGERGSGTQAPSLPWRPEQCPLQLQRAPQPLGCPQGVPSVGPVRVPPAWWVVEGPLQESGGRWLSCLAWRAGWTPAPWDSEFLGWTWGAASCQDPSLSAPPRALALLRLSSFMDLEVQAPAGPGSPVCPPPPSPACAAHFHHGGRVLATPANHSAPRLYQCAGRGRPHHFPFLPLPLASPGQLRTAIRTPEHRPFVTCGKSHPGSPSAASGAGQVVPWVVMLALVMVVMEMVELLSTGSTAPGPSGPGRSLAAVESCGLPLTQQHPAGPSASTLPVLSSPSPRCHRGWGGQCQVATVGGCLPSMRPARVEPCGCPGVSERWARGEGDACLGSLCRPPRLLRGLEGRGRPGLSGVAPDVDGLLGLGPFRPVGRPLARAPEAACLLGSTLL